MNDIQVDHPYIATEETKHWLKLDDLKDVSPCDIVLMNNMDVLLHLLQKTLQAQEGIIHKIDKKSVHNIARPTASKTDIKWFKLTHSRSATPAQFVVMSNLWQLFQILQSLHQSQEKVLQTLEMDQKGRAKKARMDASDDTNSDSSFDSNGSDAPSNQEAQPSSEPLPDIIDNALDYAYEVYNKFLANTGCHPYITNRPSCQKASKAFREYFIRHEDLIEDSQIGNLVEKLDDNDARILFITLSKKYNEAKKKGKRCIDKGMLAEAVSDSPVVSDEQFHIDTNKRLCVGHSPDKNAPFGPQHPQNPSGSLRSTIQHANNGILFPVSQKKDIQPQVDVDISRHYNKGRQPHGANTGLREPLKEKRNLPEVGTSQRGGL